MSESVTTFRSGPVGTMASPQEQNKRIAETQTAAGVMESFMGTMSAVQVQNGHITCTKVWDLYLTQSRFWENLWRIRDPTLAGISKSIYADKRECHCPLQIEISQIPIEESHTFTNMYVATHVATVQI